MLYSGLCMVESKPITYLLFLFCVIMQCVD